MSQTPDDLEAVRAIVKALESFDAKDQDRIIRWAKEKLGHPTESPPPQTSGGVPLSQPPSATQADIKTFIARKNPKSDNQLAAAVAYYYRFEAAESVRKNAITKEDLQNACRLAGVDRLNRPEQTLVNAHHAGLLDKGSEKGTYAINSVGENLVAMTLPSAAKKTQAKKKSPTSRRKRTKK